MDDIQETVYNALPNCIHSIIATSDNMWDEDTKLDADVCTYSDYQLVIYALAQDDITANKPTPHKKLLTTVKNCFNKKSSKYELSILNKTKH